MHITEQTACSIKIEIILCPALKFSMIEGAGNEIAASIKWKLFLDRY